MSEIWHEVSAIAAEAASAAGAELPGLTGPEVPGAELPGVGGPELPGLSRPELPGLGGTELPGLNGLEVPGRNGTEGSAGHEMVRGDAWSVPGEKGPELGLDRAVKGDPEDSAGTGDRPDPERK